MFKSLSKKLSVFYATCIGIILGMVSFLTIESKAPSYLSSDSRACANCHVMLTAYNTWELSAHREHASCNDCHIPQENIVRKYAAKAQDGFRHTYVFTMNSYPEVIRATPNARKSRVVTLNASRMVQFATTNSLLKPERNSKTIGKTCV